MSRLNTLTDYLLWPLLLGGALTGFGLGMAYGYSTWGFNITYLILAVTLFYLEKYRTHEEEWLESDGQAHVDLAHTLFNKISVQVLIVSLTNFGIAQQFGGRDSGGLWPSQWPFFFQLAFGLVVAEFGLYWAHRLGHEWSIFWRFHAVHHSSKKLWFFNTGRFHFVDTLKSMIFSGVMIALVGAPGDVILWGSAITAFIGMLTHCNVRLDAGWLNYVFNTPNLHRWHHSRDLREGNKNYGENLVIWDQIFRTYFHDKTRRPPANIGIGEALPRGFFGQLATPFYWEKYQASPKGDTVNSVTGERGAARLHEEKTATTDVVV